MKSQKLFVKIQIGWCKRLESSCLHGMWREKRRNMKKMFGLVAATFLATTVVCQATTINFDDGTGGSSVGSFYSGLGVTFSNATWDSNFGEAGSSGALGIRATSNGGVDSNAFIWTSATPVIALFSSAVSSVGIRGLDVGANGLRIDAYDATVGGNLVSTTTVFGTGFGTDQFFDLTATGSILRLEIYQPQDIEGDGIILDNFSIASGAPIATPLPAALPLFASGLGALGLLGWRRKRNHIVFGFILYLLAAAPVSPAVAVPVTSGDTITVGLGDIGVPGPWLTLIFGLDTGTNLFVAGDSFHADLFDGGNSLVSTQAKTGVIGGFATFFLPGPVDNTGHVVVTFDDIVSPLDIFAVNMTAQVGPQLFSGQVEITNPTVAHTPLPSTLPLFVTGLGALGLLGWRRKKKAAALTA